jgi:hypothetical protein
VCVYVCLCGQQNVFELFFFPPTKFCVSIQNDAFDEKLLEKAFKKFTIFFFYKFTNGKSFIMLHICIVEWELAG